ncbi:MAG: outer membrane beta-barrel protein [Bacteroidales bacterium]|jgi:hypothetical protein|nr:outer membrane beta-barrel protein [Bacteroidales bacterium]
MKRIVLVLVIFSAFSFLKGQGLEIGVYTEPQFTWITSDEGRVVNNGSALNLNTGIEFDMFFMPNYAFTLGLNLNNQGGKLLYTDSLDFLQTTETLTVPGGSSVKHNLQYMGIPLGLKLRTEEMGYTTIYFHGGITPLFNIRATTSSESPLMERENIKPEIYLFNINYFIEVGMEYRLAGNTAIIAGFKWSAGFRDVTKNDFANTNINSAGLHIGLLF